MKLSEIINFYQEEKSRVGDVEVYREVSDGKSTYAIPYTPNQLKKCKIWPSHPEPAKWYLK